jgi:hypothetical protein
MLEIPYVSQIQPGALQHNNDCGAASVLMVLRGYSLYKTATVDKIYDLISPAGDVPLSATGLRSLLATNKIPSEWKVGLAIHDMYDVLVARRPIIALIHYAPLVAAGLTEKTGFKGAHFVVIIGMDIENIYIHDPYSTVKGEKLPVPVTVFNQAWTECNLDGNPICAAIFMTPPLQDLSVQAPSALGIKYEFGTLNGIPVNGLNVRSGPGDTYPVLRTIWRSDTPYVYILRTFWDRGLLVDNSGWVYMPCLRKV